MRVALEQRVVHEGPGVALVGVADHVLQIARCLPARLPLAARGEAGATTPAQAGALDLLEDRSGPHLQSTSQGRVAAERDVGVDGSRVEEAVVAQQHPLLPAVEGDLILLAASQVRRGVHAEQPLHDLAAEHRLLDDLGHVPDLHVLVDDALGKQREQRATLAEPLAAGGARLDFAAAVARLHLGPQGVVHPDRSIRPAAGADAHGDDPLAGASGGDERLSIARELSWVGKPRGHSRSSLSRSFPTRRERLSAVM